MSRRLSVIVPSIDAPDILRSHLTGLAEHGDRIELILVASGYAAGPVLADLESRFAQTRIIQDQDRSQADAINRGAALATGEALTWLNTDDRLAPGAVDAVLDRLAADQGAAVIYGDAEVHLPATGGTRRYPVLRRINQATLLQGCGISQPAAWIRTAAWDRVGGLDSSYDCAFDYDLWLRLAAEGVEFARIEQVLAHVSLGPQAKTYARRDRVLVEDGLVRLAHGGRLPPGFLDALLAEMGQELQQIDPKLPVRMVRSIDQIRDELARAAATHGDHFGLNRLEQDLRFGWAEDGLYIRSDYQGWFTETLEILADPAALPRSILVAFDEALMDPSSVSVVLEDHWIEAPSVLLAGGNQAAFRLTRPAGVPPDEPLRFRLSLLSTAAGRFCGHVPG